MDLTEWFWKNVYIIAKQSHIRWAGSYHVYSLVRPKLPGWLVAKWLDSLTNPRTEVRGQTVRNVGGSIHEAPIGEKQEGEGLATRVYTLRYNLV